MPPSLQELPANDRRGIEYVLDLHPRYQWIVGLGSADPAPHVSEVEVDDLTARFRRVRELPPRV